jgi:hypothetical protein
MNPDEKVIAKGFDDLVRSAGTNTTLARIYTQAKYGLGMRADKIPWYQKEVRHMRSVSWDS